MQLVDGAAHAVDEFFDGLPHLLGREMGGIERALGHQRFADGAQRAREILQLGGFGGGEFAQEPQQRAQFRGDEHPMLIQAHATVGDPAGFEEPVENVARALPQILGSRALVVTELHAGMFAQDFPDQDQGIRVAQLPAFVGALLQLVRAIDVHGGGRPGERAEKAVADRIAEPGAEQVRFH